MMRVKTESLSVNVSISDLISTAADAAGALVLNSEANFHFFLAEQKMHERCASICNLVNRSMHAPTIMTLAEVMLKISRAFPSERNRICMSLQRNNGADLAVLHRVIGEERDPFLAFKDASPAAADVVTLVDCVHHRIRGKVVWEDVSKLKLGKRSVTAKSPSNTIFATELGLWFTCAEDEGDDTRCVRACVSMKDVHSIQIDEGNSSTCKISLLTALDSFGDVSIETATSAVYITMKNPSEAQGFVADMQQKFDLFKKLDEFARRSAVSKISIASASTASLYRSQDGQAAAALLPKKSKENDKKSSVAVAKSNKLPIVSTKAAAQPIKALTVASISSAGAGKKKIAPSKESFVQDDLSMDIDYGNDDCPMDVEVSHDFTSNGTRCSQLLCACSIHQQFCQLELTFIQMYPRSLLSPPPTIPNFPKSPQNLLLEMKLFTGIDLLGNLKQSLRKREITLPKNEVFNSSKFLYSSVEVLPSLIILPGKNLLLPSNIGKPVTRGSLGGLVFVSLLI